MKIPGKIDYRNEDALFISHFFKLQQIFRVDIERVAHSIHLISKIALAQAPDVELVQAHTGRQTDTEHPRWQDPVACALSVCDQRSQPHRKIGRPGKDDRSGRHALARGQRKLQLQAGKLQIAPLVIEDLDADIAKPARPVQCRALRACLLYTSPSPRDRQKSRMPSSA